MGFVGSAFAATIKVNDTAASSVPNSCTIVDAVASINQGSLVANSNCANNGSAFGTNDTVDLSAFTSPTSITFGILATGSALTLSKPVTITGNLDSAGKPLLTIARTMEFANNNYRLIDTTANLKLRGVMLDNGHTTANGGALQAGTNATVTLINSVIRGSRADGTGGGIDAMAAVTLINSTLSDNHATSFGGGINTGSAGSVTATGSTISINTAGSSGGGIFANTVDLTNTTISGNSAGANGGGIYAQNATLNFCTIAGNSVVGSGGGLFIGSLAPTPTLAATATLMYGNTPSNDIDSSAAQTLSGDHNLIGVASRNITKPADTLGCDPKLDLLADNGGPTQTQALAAGSCAIDAGPAFPPGTIPSDQRGNQYARRVGNATDIGAYEAFLVSTNDRIFYDGFGL
jgi:predicted outer membrane repeat protein